MQTKILKATTFLCACGNKFYLSTSIDKEMVNLETCAKCHPAYQGKSGLVSHDVEKRVDKFSKKFGNIDL